MSILLWIKTKELGCGAQQNDKNEYFIICIYNPTLSSVNDFRIKLPELKTNDNFGIDLQHSQSRNRILQSEEMLPKNDSTNLETNGND